ncbi:MAG: hypothetical protein AAB538_01200 [Patescibacteria group bacterium]
MTGDRVVLFLLVVLLGYQQYQIWTLRPDAFLGSGASSSDVASEPVPKPLLLVRDFSGVVRAVNADSVRVGVSIPVDPRGLTEALEKEVTVIFDAKTTFLEGERERIRVGSTVGITARESISENSTVTAANVILMKEK